MIMRLIVKAITACLLIGLLFLTGGCGYKTPAIPPGKVSPMAISDLLYTTSEEGATLTWSYPVKTRQGEVVEDISSFIIYRAEVSLEDYCAKCPIPWEKPIEIEGGPPFDGDQRRKASYLVPDLKSGYKYFFKVNSFIGWLSKSRKSNIVSFIWTNPSAAPEGVSTVSGDQEITLTWQPVTTFSDGTPLEEEVRYQILRSAGGKGFEKIGEPIEDLTFIDKQVTNSQKYYYVVQSVRIVEEEYVEGGRSSEVSVTPLDRTPPPPPTGVTAVKTSVGVKIFWDKSSDESVGAYKVYRRASDKDTYKLLGKVEPEFTLFVDRKNDGKIRYYYAVTTLDSSVPPNESIKSREATIRN